MSITCDLVKAAGKAGLVQVQRQVSRNGKTFTQNFWIKPGDVKSTDTVLGQQNTAAPKTMSSELLKQCQQKIVDVKDKWGDKTGEQITGYISGAKHPDGSKKIAALKKDNGRWMLYHGSDKTGMTGYYDLGVDEGKAWEEFAKELGLSHQGISSQKPEKQQVSSSIPQGETKKAMVDLLSTHGRDALIAHAQSNGVIWKPSDNPGINWMRASMAIQKHMTSNPGVWDSTKIGASTQQPTTQQADTQATPSTDQSAQSTQQIDHNKKQPPSDAPAKATSDAKSKVKGLAENMGKDQLMAAAKQAGIAWTESNNPGINWMRAAMAMAKNPDALDNLQAPSQSGDIQAQTQAKADKAAKDAKQAQKAAQSAQKQVKQLQDLVSQLQAQQQQPTAQQQQASVLSSVTTGFKSDREQKVFGNALSKATPEQFVQARTLGMCAGDSDAADYLNRLYGQYVHTVLNPKANGRDDRIDPDALRNKLQGVVNKQVVGVVKSSLSKVRKRTTQFTLQQKLLEPWTNPNASLTPEQDQKIKDERGGTAQGSMRQRMMMEQDGSHTLMKQFLDKMEQHPDYSGLVPEYRKILEEFDKLTENDPDMQTYTNHVHSIDQVMSSLKSRVLEAQWAVDKAQKSAEETKKIYEGHIETERKSGDPSAAANITMYQKIIQQGFDRAANASKRLDAAKAYQEHFSTPQKKVELAKAIELRKQLFDPKFTDINANLWHFKAMGIQIATQYKTSRDFVAEYPVLSKADIDKLETGDQDSLTNLALYAGMFKPSLTKKGGTADQAIMDKFAERQAFLDAYTKGGLVSGRNGQGDYTEDNEIKCMVSSAPDTVVKQITANIAADWDKKNHGHMKYRIKGVYEVSGLALEKDFQAIKQKNAKYKGKKVGGKDCAGDLFYHGTGAMATSLILGHSGAFKVVKAKVGRMLGNGIYLADKSSKSAQYISDAGYSRSGIQGSLMVVEAVTGDTLSQRTSQGYNHDTVFAGTQHGLLNSEWCVHDPNAVIPRYLVEMEVL